MSNASDLRRFYELLERLAVKIGGPRILGSAEGTMVWPSRGVYFFLEKGEFRSGSGTGSRVVRVGTHALNAGASSTLWGRLAQHRGAVAGGNHRGSVFRRHVGRAIAARDPATSVPSWGRGSSAPPEFAQHERELESQVSAVIGEMSVLLLAVDDEPGPKSQQSRIGFNPLGLPFIAPDVLQHADAVKGQTDDSSLPEGIFLANDNRGLLHG